ncbi:MAG: hypothetical protein ACRDO2_01675 [Nocardioidaceae bacterium]
MRSTLRRLSPRHTTVAAYLALFLAVGGGTAYAASAITGEDILDGTLTSADLGPAAVTEEKLGTGAVTPSKVYDETLTGADIKDGTLAGKELAAETITSDKVKNGGITGLDILDNTVTSNDLNVNVKTVSATSTYGYWQVASANCPVGYTLLGGGGAINAEETDKIEINESYPSANGWHVMASQEERHLVSAEEYFSVTAYAICAAL